MENKIRRFLTLVFFCFLFGSLGCGDTKSTGNLKSEGDFITYILEETNIDIPSSMAIDSNAVYLVNEELFLLERKEISSHENIGMDYIIYKHKLSDDSSDLEEIVGLSAKLLLSFKVFEADEVVLSLLYEDNDVLCIEEYDCEGVLKCTIVLDDKQIIDSHFENMSRTIEGNYIVSNGLHMYSVQRNGGMTEINLPSDISHIADVCHGVNNMLWVSYMNEEKQYYVRKMNLETGMFSEMVKIPGNGLLFNHGREVCIVDSEKAYLLMDNKNSNVEVLDLSEYQEGTTYIKDVCYLQNDIFIVSWNDKKDGRPVRVLHFKNYQQHDLESSYVKEKRQSIQIYDPYDVIALLDDTQQIMNDFNDENKEYYVTVIKGATETMGVDIISDSDLDILLNLSVGDIDTLIAQNFVEDLVPLMKTISSDQLHPKVWEAFGRDNALYAISKQIPASTILCKGQGLNDNGGWTTEEFLNWLEKNHDIYTIFQQYDKLSIVYWIMQGDLDKYCDFENKRCDFKSQEYQTIMRRIKEMDVEFHCGQYSEIPKDAAVLFEGNINSLFSIAYDEAMLGDNYVHMGYPNSLAKKKSILYGIQSFSILSTSKKKEGAMAFLEYWVHYPGYSLTELERNENLSDGKPYALKEYWNKEVELSQGTRTLKIGNVEYKINVTEHTNDLFKEVFNNSKRKTNQEQDIWEIIFEEMSYYFYGSQDLDSVCDVIQSRVTVLLNE